VVLPRERKLRGRDYFSLFGKFAEARTCYRAAGEPGIFPLDQQVNLPERCYSYFLQEWMTLRRLRKSGRETLAKIITFLHNHRRWMKYDEYLAAGLPVGTGVVEMSQLYCPYTDNCFLSYDCPDWMIEPRRRCRHVSVSGRGRERERLSTHVLPPRL